MQLTLGGKVQTVLGSSQCPGAAVEPAACQGAVEMAAICGRVFGFGVGGSRVGSTKP